MPVARGDADRDAVTEPGRMRSDDGDDDDDVLSRNKDVVLRFLDAGHRADMATVDSLITDDVMKFGPRPSSPFPSPVRGRENLLAGYHHWVFQPRSISMEVERVIAEGDLVAVQFILRAITAKGEPYESFYHFLFQCEGGRVKSFWEYVDTQYAQRMLFDDRPDPEDGAG